MKKWRQLNVAGMALAATLLIFPFQNCSNESPSGNAGASSQSSSSGLRLKFQAGSAKQTAELKTVGLAWTDVPGVKVEVTLNSAATVHMSARGSGIYSSGSASGAIGYCGFRFVVDGTPYGNASWGDAIVSSNTWNPWSIERHLDLQPGPHTIKLQQSGYSGTDMGCQTYAEDYSAARLNVEAY